MNEVYLTNVYTVKIPKSYSTQNMRKNSSLLKQEPSSEKELSKKFRKRIINEIKEIKENSEEIKHSIKDIKKCQFKEAPKKNIKLLNNFISSEDKDKFHKKLKQNFIPAKKFTQIRQKNIENRKNKEKITNEIKDDYVNYIISNEPKFVEVDQITEEYMKKVYNNHQKYNENLIIIERKKEEKKMLSYEIEKSLINNYFIKDSSMLPIYEQLIEKVKLDILKKQQEHDGYYSLYEELYNKNFEIRRKVLDEIELDRVNENFYDQYKILKNQTLTQMQKKQEAINKIEEYQAKVLEAYAKEIREKNEILKDLRLQIEVYKESEKDSVRKIKELMVQIKTLKKIIFAKDRRRKYGTESYISHAIKYYGDFTEVEIIFKSVNAKNFEDILNDATSINAKFSQLKNHIININFNISKLNNELCQLNKQIIKIYKKIDLAKQKKYDILNPEEQARKELLLKDQKKLKDSLGKLSEIYQSSIGKFQKGINFIFAKVREFIFYIKDMKTIVSPKFLILVESYKNQTFSINYQNIDKKFLTNFCFIFFQFYYIILYLIFHSLSSYASINNVNDSKMIYPLLDNSSLNSYNLGSRKIQQEYDKRSKLRNIKQKEMVEKMKKENEERLEKFKLTQNKFIGKNETITKFSNYLLDNTTKDSKSQNFNSDNVTTSKNSVFFTSVNVLKAPIYYNSSYNNSISTGKTLNKESLQYNNYTLNKIDYLKKNQNKFSYIFSKYENSLAKEEKKKLYFEKKKQKKKQLSHRENYYSKKSNLRNLIINREKKKIEEETNYHDTKPIRQKLLDDNYEYESDETEEKNNIIKKTYMKKNVSSGGFTFFKFDIDRANIYKRISDLRVLQMGYFGGRLISTKIKPQSNSLSSYHDFLRKKMQFKTRNKKYKSKINLNPQGVFSISANKKFNNHTISICKKSFRSNVNKKDEISKNINFLNFKVKSPNISIINKNKKYKTIYQKSRNSFGKNSSKKEILSCKNNKIFFEIL